jgi:hypothetical protein
MLTTEAAMRAGLGLVAIVLSVCIFAGAITAAIWLAVLGEWGTLGIGICAIAIAPFLLRILNVPGLAFGAPGAVLLRRSRPNLAFPLVLLAQLYTHLVVGVWAFAVFFTVAPMIDDTNFWPMLLWSNAIAIGPGSYMAPQEGQAGGGSGELITIVFAQLAYFAMACAGLILNLHLGSLALVFGVVMLISVWHQTRKTVASGKWGSVVG